MGLEDAKNIPTRLYHFYSSVSQLYALLNREMDLFVCLIVCPGFSHMTLFLRIHSDVLS